MDLKNYLLFFLLTPHIIQCINLKTIWKNPFVQKHQGIITKEYACSKNATLEIENERGNITITSWKQPKIVIETTLTGTEESVKQTKIQINQLCEKTSINAITTDNDLQIDYHILAPESVALSSISTQQGSTKIKHIKGPMTITASNGDVEIINAEKTVIVQSVKGNVIIRQTQLPTEAAIIVESTNGNVELSLTTGINADLNLQTNKGIIASEQPITLNEITTKINRLTWENIAKNVQAKLGSGGAQVSVKISQRGDINLTEY